MGRCEAIILLLNTYKKAFDVVAAVRRVCLSVTDGKIRRERNHMRYYDPFLSDSLLLAYR